MGQFGIWALQMHANFARSMHNNQAVVTRETG